MSDPLLREMDHYVVLEPGGQEAILTAEETRTWLARHLSSLSSPPADLA
ncbi:MAG: chlororespiratory reduction protein 7, partial [Cyanobacteriota bacterium]|nr:chlororespiratory reduction protein 7 [Cyanobacteriota bacterium]